MCTASPLLQILLQFKLHVSKIDFPMLDSLDSDLLSIHIPTRSD